MAAQEVPLSDKVRKQVKPLPTDFDGWMRRADQQRKLAREMIESAREMSDRAAEMRKHPNFRPRYW
jgi:hypothetical protein